MTDKTETAKTKFEVEKNIPIPKMKTGPGRSSIYPWEELEVGDSFFVPGKTPKQMSGLASSRSKRGDGVKFKTRSVEGGCRVWRVA